jgi:TonB family protein
VLLFTRTPKPFPGNLPPRYPARLEVLGIPGKVLVRFVVDTAGRVEMGTLTVLASTDPGFTAAVRDVMPQWRFQAATVGGRKVRQLVQIPILFSVPR